MDKVAMLETSVLFMVPEFCWLLFLKMFDRAAGMVENRCPIIMRQTWFFPLLLVLRNSQVWTTWQLMKALRHFWRSALFKVPVPLGWIPTACFNACVMDSLEKGMFALYNKNVPSPEQGMFREIVRSKIPIHSESLRKPGVMA
jgi:hypothetical protein